MLTDAERNELMAGEPVCLNCQDLDRFCPYCGEEFDAKDFMDPQDEGFASHIEFSDDGQPTEYEEWQDVFGGDEDPGDYDQFEGAFGDEW